MCGTHIPVFVCIILFRRFHGARGVRCVPISRYDVLAYVYGETVIAEFKRDRGNNNRMFYT